MNESIQGFVDRSIIILNQNTQVKAAARTMTDRQVGCVLVSSEHHIVGIVTDRDLATRVLGFDRPGDLPLSEVMTTEVVSVDRSASISEVLKIMEVNGVRRVPVLDHTRHGIEQCVGLLTLDDLIAIEAVPLSQLSRIIKSQILRKLQYHRMHHGGKEENREQSLNHFYAVLAKEIGVSREMTERVTYFLLKDILQKVPFVNAAHFISQLPSLMRSEMMNIPAGPRRELKAKNLIEDLRIGFHFNEEQALHVVRSFWKGLKTALNPEIVEYIEVVLPRDFRNLLQIMEIKGRKPAQAKPAEQRAPL